MTPTSRHGPSSGCADRVDIWRLDLDEPLPPEALATLSDDERRRGDRLPGHCRRRRWLAGRAWLRRILGGYTGRQPASLAFGYGGHGKPVLIDAAEPHFNLAHAGRHALVAASGHRPVGVDLELARPLTDIAGMARGLLSSSLAGGLARLPPAAAGPLLLRCWTRLEALGKLAGTGVAGGLAVLARPDAARLIGPDAGCGPHGDAWLEDIDAGPGMVAALAVGGTAAVDLTWNEPASAGLACGNGKVAMRSRLVRPAMAAAALAVMMALGPASAADWQMSGFVASELRYFPQDVRYEDQRNYHFAPSVFAEPRFEMTDEGQLLERLAFVPFARYDARDTRRTHVDIREANALFVGEGWDVVAGVDRRFWGVVESRHLVDIINQVDAVEDVTGDEKLGQPMLNANVVQPWGTLGLFVLPVARQRTFHEGDARLRGPVPIRTGNVEYGADAGRWDVALALRYAHTIGPLDIGIAHFHGVGREPRLLPQLEPDTGQVLYPFYELIDQTSLDSQLTLGDWLWKLEAIVRSGQGQRFGAAIGGLEYTFVNALDSDIDVGLLAEYLWDDRHDETFPTVFEDDIFLGVRVNLNDPETTTLLAGITVDREDRGSAFRLESARRIGDHWRVSVDAHFFWHADEDDLLYSVEKDGFVQLRLAYFF